MKSGKILLRVAVVFLALVLFALLYLRKLEQPPARGVSSVFTVEHGWGVTEVARALEDSGLVKNRWMVLLHYRRSFPEKFLQAGRYSLSDTMQTDSILSLFVSGRVIPVPTSWVTLPPGLRLEESFSLLSESLGIPLEELQNLSMDGEFLDAIGVPCLEGYLFPETYEFADSTHTWNVIDRIVRTGFGVMDSVWENQCMETGLSPFQAVVLASIVEREAAADSERPLIAGVFLNRLRKGMKLESCATVQYALGEVHDVLLYSDLETESPYNTYLHNGLPPAPICSPGRASLEAVANPDTVAGYLFFVSKGDGSGEHLFAVTAAGHAANIRAVREGS